MGRANRQAEYTITTSIEELSAKSGGDGYVGKLRGLNLAGTEYTLYDDGRSPNKSKSKKHQSAADRLRRELIAIIYVSTVGSHVPVALIGRVPGTSILHII